MGVRRGISIRLLIVGVVGLALLVAPISCGSSDDSSSPETSAAPAHEASYRVSADGKDLIGPNDQQIPIRSQSAKGYVDNSIAEHGEVSVIGWAASGSLKKAATLVIGAVDGKSVASAKPSTSREDVAEAYEAPELSQSGFVIRFSSSELECAAPDGGLTVFAVYEDEAAPLTWVGEGLKLAEKAC